MSHVRNTLILISNELSCKNKRNLGFCQKLNRLLFGNLSEIFPLTHTHTSTEIDVSDKNLTQDDFYWFFMSVPPS
jgi:hypothetical protein